MVLFALLVTSPRLGLPFPALGVPIGGSMYPTVKAGDWVLAVPGRPARGDVVIARHGASMILHRVVETLPDGRAVTKGDALPSPDGASTGPFYVVVAVLPPWFGAVLGAALAASAAREKPGHQLLAAVLVAGFVVTAAAKSGADPMPGLMLSPPPAGAAANGTIVYKMPLASYTCSCGACRYYASNETLVVSGGCVVEAYPESAVKVLAVLGR